MLKKSFFILVLIFSLTILFTRFEDLNSTNSNLPITETDAIQKSSQLSPGTVTKAELTTHNGIKVWEVYMTATSGGELKIKYRVDDGTMIEIKGNSLSNNNEVRPGINLINYCIARSVALSAKNGEILGWKLEKD